MRRFTFSILPVLLISACSSNPNLANDPSGGGFFGGVTGLARGDYEARKHEREDSLSLLERSQRELDQENASLTTAKRSQQAEVAQWQRKLARLKGDIRSLSTKVAALKNTQQSQQAGASRLRQQVRTLEADMRRLEKKSQQPSLQQAQLEAQRRKLEKEYDALFAFYLALEDD